MLQGCLKFTGNLSRSLFTLAGGHVFFNDLGDADDNFEGQHFSLDYWQVLSPVLTKLHLEIRNEKSLFDSEARLNSMQNLQHLEILGRCPHSHGIPHSHDFNIVSGITLLPSSQILPLTPRQHHAFLHDVGVDGKDVSLVDFDHLRLPALKFLRLEELFVSPTLHLDCPSLETLRLRDLAGPTMPTGLGTSRCLTTLDIATPMGLVHLVIDPGLLMAIEAVQATLEFLDISGWAPSLNGVFELISRLPRLHTLVAQCDGLIAVPALPAILKSLDLRANEFTEVPEQLESLTQLTCLAISSKKSSTDFQIKRPLGPLISMPQLQELTLVLDCEAKYPKHTKWTARSLGYLGLAQHEIARSKRTLLLKF